MPNEPSFAENFLHESLRSLLHEDSTISELDLRGNGLLRDDVRLAFIIFFEGVSGSGTSCWTSFRATRAWCVGPHTALWSQEMKA